MFQHECDIPIDLIFKILILHDSNLHIVIMSFKIALKIVCNLCNNKYLKTNKTSLDEELVNKICNKIELNLVKVLRVMRKYLYFKFVQKLGLDYFLTLLNYFVQNNFNDNKLKTGLETNKMMKTMSEIGFFNHLIELTKIDFDELNILAMFYLWKFCIYGKNFNF